MNDDGELAEDLRTKPHGPQAQLAAQIDKLLWYADALKKARQ